jgi:predicted DNA-binding transcriptional regulator AlpA
MAIDYLDSVRVLTKKETLHATGLSEDTWDRLKERGETPPETQLSERRFGYRLIDVKEWLDRRRIGRAAATAAILFLTIIDFSTLPSPPARLLTGVAHMNQPARISRVRVGLKSLPYGVWNSPIGSLPANSALSMPWTWPTRRPKGPDCPRPSAMTWCGPTLAAAFANARRL